MIQFQENAWTGGQMEERNDGKALFYRTLPATTRSPKSATLV